MISDVDNIKNISKLATLMKGKDYINQLNIICGNIVSDEILNLGDVIVNPTNPMMRPGGGVSGEIFRKAGVDILESYTSQNMGFLISIYKAKMK